MVLEFINQLTVEIKIPVVPEMWNCFGIYFPRLSSFDILN